MLNKIKKILGLEKEVKSFDGAIKFFWSDNFTKEVLISNNYLMYRFNLLKRIYYNNDIIFAVVNIIRYAFLRLNFEFNFNDKDYSKYFLNNLPAFILDYLVCNYIFFNEEGVYIPAELVEVKQQNELEVEFFYKKNKLFYIKRLDGVSPLIPAFNLIEKSFILTQREKEVLQNAGATGLFLLRDDSGYAALTKEQLDTFYKILKDKVLKGGLGGFAVINYPLDYKEIGLKPADLQIKELRINLYRELCNLYGIDSSLLNDPDNKTYSNKTESYRGLYENTVIPMANDFVTSVYELGIQLGKFNLTQSLENAVSFNYDNITYLNE